MSVAGVRSRTSLCPFSWWAPKPYTTRNYRVIGLATSSLLIVWVYLHSSLRDGLRKRMYFETECIVALQGHPRSLILAPVEIAYATSY